MAKKFFTFGCRIVHSKHVHRTGVRNQYETYIEKVKVENYLEDLGIDGTILLKRILDK
jgi:hypothetical protein